MATVLKEQRRDRSGKPVTKWVVRWRDPDGKQRERTYGLSSEARAFAARVEADKHKGEYKDPRAGQVTVVDFVSEYLSGFTGAPGTLEKYLVILNKHVVPVLGGFPLNKLRRSHVQGWVHGMSASGLAPSTVRHALKVFSGWMNVAVGDRLIGENPCKRVTPPALPARRPVLLSPQDVALIKAAMPERYQALVLVVVATGLRQAEAFGLTTSRVDFLRAVIRVDRQVITTTGARGQLVNRTKTQASVRSIPVPRMVTDALATHLERWPQPDPDAPIFLNQEGRPLQRGHFNQVWKRACRTAGVLDDRHHGFHSLRHYYASQLIAAGQNPKIVQSRLGHASITETMDTYGHLFPEAEDETRLAVAAVLEGLTPPADLMLTLEGKLA